MKHLKNRSSQPYIWLAVIIAIIVLGWVMSLVGYPMHILYNRAANDTVINTDPQIETFMIRSLTVWTWIPLFAIFCLILWAIIQIHKKRNYGGLV